MPKDASRVSTEAKAGYICGVYAALNGLKSSRRDIKQALERLLPHARTAAQIAFDEGAFNPMAVWEMESEFDRLYRAAQALADEEGR